MSAAATPHTLNPHDAAASWRSGRRSPFVRDGRILVTILGAKAAVILIIFMAYKLEAFAAQNFWANFMAPGHEDISVWTAFSTWDAQHYIYLSEYGYRPRQLSNVYFPLFPGLIHAGTWLLGSSLVAALVVSNVASLIGLFLLVKLVDGMAGRASGERTLALYLAAPTAFFFTVPYTESLFLLLIVLFFFLLARGRMWWAAIPAALLAVTRPTGIIVLVPFVAYYVVEVLGIGRAFLGSGRVPLGPATSGQPLTRGSALLRGLPLLAPLVGLAAYLAYMNAVTGNALAVAESASMNVSGFSMTLFTDPAKLGGQLFRIPLMIYGFNDSMIDRAYFAAFLALLIPLFRRLHISLALYAVAAGTISIVSGSFVSYSRYSLIAFPTYITLSLLLERPGVRFLRQPLIHLFLLVQGLFLVMHALNYWMA